MPTPDPWAWRPAVPSRREIPLTLLRLDGADTRRFLHGQTSQDLALAPAGAWRRTCCLTATARLRGLAEVLIDGEGAWLAIRVGDPEAVRQAFDRVLFPADDVRLGALQPGLWLEPAETAAPALGGRWEPLQEGAGWRLEGGAVLLPEGAPLPGPLALRPVLEPLQAERLRIARGEAAAPAELNEDVNPFELGLADWVSLSKGCYIGQETLAKLATYDGVKQQLRRWHRPAGPGAAAPQPGAELRNDEGGRAGQITSVLALPEGGWIGLALVRRGALAAARLGAADGGWVEPSVPEGVAPPPVGAGGRQAGGGSSVESAGSTG